jgi:hypothetical protein
MTLKVYPRKFGRRELAYFAIRVRWGLTQIVITMRKHI